MFGEETFMRGVTSYLQAKYATFQIALFFTY